MKYINALFFIGSHERVHLPYWLITGRGKGMKKPMELDCAGWTEEKVQTTLDGREDRVGVDRITRRMPERSGTQAAGAF